MDVKVQPGALAQISGRIIDQSRPFDGVTAAEPWKTRAHLSSSLCINNCTYCIACLYFPPSLSDGVLQTILPRVDPRWDARHLRVHVHLIPTDPIDTRWADCVRLPVYKLGLYPRGVDSCLAIEITMSQAFQYHERMSV